MNFAKFLKQLFCRTSKNGYFWLSEAVARRCFIQKMLLKMSQNSQENTSVGVSFLIKLQTLWPATLLKKGLRHWCFPVNFTKFLRLPFLQFSIAHFRWLLSGLTYFLIYFIALVRGSRSYMLFKIGVLKNFANFTGKYLFGISF